MGCALANLLLEVEMPRDSFVKPARGLFPLKCARASAGRRWGASTTPAATGIWCFSKLGGSMYAKDAIGKLWTGSRTQLVHARRRLPCTPVVPASDPALQHRAAVSAES